MIQSMFFNNALERSGYTQKELSEKTGIPTGTLGKLFAGTPGTTISVEYLVRLSVALDFSLDDYASAVYGVARRGDSSSPEDAAMLAQMHGWVKNEIGRYAEIPESFWTRLLYAVSDTVHKVEKDRLVLMHMKREHRHNIFHVCMFFMIILSFVYFYFDASHHDWGLIRHDIHVSVSSAVETIPTATPTPTTTEYPSE